jgi:aminoglycoside phosphotransferase (APT) family kinase protein
MALANEFRTTEVASTIEEVLLYPVVSMPVRIAKGFANENWIVETEEGRLLCKIAPPDAPVPKWRAAVFGHQLAEKHGIPVPRLLACSNKTESLGNRLVRIYQYCEGISPDMQTAEKHAKFWVELGKAIRRLHGIELSTFSSRLDGSAPMFDSWIDYVEYRIPQINARTDVSGYLNLKQLGHLWDCVLSSAAMVTQSIKPCLTHRDLHPDNLLVSQDGSLSSILDFDCAEAWDPVADFFKLKWWIFNKDYQAELLFHRGYGDPYDIYEQFTGRLQTISTLELVNIIANCDPDEIPYAKREYQRLRQITEETGWPLPEFKI